MSPVPEKTPTLRSRPRKILAQLGRAAEASFHDSLLLMTDIGPGEFLYIYSYYTCIHQIVEGMETRTCRRTPDGSRDVESRSMGNRTSIDLRHNDTFAAVEENAAVRCSRKVDRRRTCCLAN